MQRECTAADRQQQNKEQTAQASFAKACGLLCSSANSLIPYFTLAQCGLDIDCYLMKVLLYNFLKNYLRLRRRSKVEVEQSWPILQPLLSLMALKLKRNCKELSRTLLRCKEERERREREKRRGGEEHQLRV